MRIRPYSENLDFEYLKQWIGGEREHALWCANMIPYPVTQENLRDFLLHAAKEWVNSAYMATEDDGTVIGFFCYSVNIKNNEGFLKLIIIDDRKRGAGYGKKMLKLALRYAFEITGVDLVRLNVFTENAGAIRCYENVGFSVRVVAENVFPYKGELWSRCSMAVSRNEET